MPCKRRKRERLKQLEEWLRANYQTAYPVSVRVRQIDKKREVQGLCWREGKQFYIDLEKSFPLYTLVDTLFHEWAHAMTYKHENLEKIRRENVKTHDDEFFLAYGRIYRHFYDFDGYKESYNY